MKAPIGIVVALVLISACGSDNRAPESAPTSPSPEPAPSERPEPPELLAAEQALSAMTLTNSLQAQELQMIAAPDIKIDPVLAMSDRYDENPDRYPEYSWLDLVPENFFFSSLLDQVQERYPEVDFAMMDDWDPQAMKALDYLRELTDAAPVREDLDGVSMRIPGFLLPLDFEAQEVSSFLLVPYFGACIHTPPPPANQIILVELQKPFRLEQMFEPVWVNGTLSASSFEAEVAMAGYRMQADLVELYDDFDY